MKYIKHIFKPFLSSIAYFCYAFLIAFGFMFIVLNSAFVGNDLRIIYSFGLGFDIFAIIFYILKVHNKSIKPYFYMIITIGLILLSYGGLTLTSALSYEIILIILGFVLGVFSFIWLIIKLIFVTKDETKHFCLVSYIYIFMIGLLSFSLSSVKIMKICKDNRHEIVAEIILNDVRNTFLDLNEDLNHITYLSYEKEELIVGATTFDGDYLMFNYNFEGTNNILDCFANILLNKAMPEFIMPGIFKTSILGLGTNIEYPLDFNYVRILTINNYKDNNSIDFASGFLTYTNNDNEIIYCSYVKKLDESNASIFTFDGLALDVVSYFITLL